MMRIGSERVHLVGIGGAGMSALARMLHRAGGDVTGSDRAPGPVVDALAAEGVPVWTGGCPDRVHGENGYVVRSAAVPANDVEVALCEERGFTSLLYAEAVGRLSEGKRTLALAGTHGKTSTTALTVAALRGAGLDPSHLIGGEVPDLGGNGHGGRDDLLVVEACEFNRSFHQLRPFGAAILNLDHDHFDCYPSPEDLIEAFAGYVARVRPGGAVLMHDAAPPSLCERVDPGARILRVGEGLFADLRPIEVEDKLGCYAFTPLFEGERVGRRVELNVPGRFQMLNALFALGLVQSVGADLEGACEGLSAFAGVRRRFELHVGRRGGHLVNDYAHHPEEIRVVIRAARQRFPGRRVLVVFQPHQYQRTLHLLEDFGAALALADECIVADIYGARESAEVMSSVSAGDLTRLIRENGTKADVGGDVAHLPALVLERRQTDDLVMVLGAGDVDTVVGDLVGAI